MHLTHEVGQVNKSTREVDQGNKSTHEVIAPNKLIKQELLWDF